MASCRDLLDKGEVGLFQKEVGEEVVEIALLLEVLAFECFAGFGCFGCEYNKRTSLPSLQVV